MPLVTSLAPHRAGFTPSQRGGFNQEGPWADAMLPQGLLELS